ncbi:hypothetical protein AJ88_37215 [Mesorhizobium amorphae CCBAU 01583]|nr:hypothetical protein AJ88_37215 [Mesorhizobium amorphae CCBAU 01583]
MQPAYQRHCRQANKRIMAHPGLASFFIALFEQEQRTGETEYGIFVGEQADDHCLPLDLVVEPIAWIGAMELRAALP